VGDAWGVTLVTYWIDAGTYEGVVMGASVALVETGSVGGLRIGPFSIQHKISLREEWCSSPVVVWWYMRV
jgi:hypothetical protein